MFKKFLTQALIINIILSIATFSQAYEDGPPNEPPYVTANDEFEPEERGDSRENASSVSGEVRLPERSGKISHPLSEQGLYLIDRDGSYYFKPERSSRSDRTSVLRIGSLRPPPGIESATSDGFISTDYITMYGSGNPMTFMYDYEWQPLQGFGRLGIQLGVGVFSSTGQGRFADGSEAREKYTFYALPLSAGIVYRFQFTERPWFSPYISGGMTYFALAEVRDDGKRPQFVGTPTAFGAGGLMLNLSEIDRHTGFIFDSEYGIHSLWLTFEFRRIQASNQDLDFTGSLLSFGISADY